MSGADLRAQLPNEIGLISHVIINLITYPVGSLNKIYYHPVYPEYICNCLVSLEWLINSDEFRSYEKLEFGESKQRRLNAIKPDSWAKVGYFENCDTQNKLQEVIRIGTKF